MERRLSTGGSCQAVWGREGLAAALDHAAPADIARKLLRRRALEAHHPELQAALAGIDVLDVTAAGRWLARAGDKCYLRDYRKHGTHFRRCEAFRMPAR